MSAVWKEGTLCDEVWQEVINYTCCESSEDDDHTT